MEMVWLCEVGCRMVNDVLGRKQENARRGEDRLRSLYQRQEEAASLAKRDGEAQSCPKVESEKKNKSVADKFGCSRRSETGLGRQ